MVTVEYNSVYRIINGLVIFLKLSIEKITNIKIFK